MPAQSFENEPLMDGSQNCEYGKATFEHSTLPTTPESWTAFMRDSLAKILAQQESKLDLAKAHAAACTGRSCESLAILDQNTFFWKTSQQSLVRELEQFTQTWPRSVMSSGQFAYELPMLAQIITVTDGGVSQNVWMTPTANLAEHPGQVAWKQGRQLRLTQQVNNPQLHPKSAKREIFAAPTTMASLPPKSEAALMREATITRKGRSKPANLRDQVVNMKHWPTPTASASNGSSEKTLTRKDGRSRIGDRLDHAVLATDGGKLNPTWTEWLMGWPIGWTGLKPSVTDKFRSKQRSRSKFSSLCTDNEESMKSSAMIARSGV